MQELCSKYKIYLHILGIEWTKLPSILKYNNDSSLNAGTTLFGAIEDGNFMQEIANQYGNYGGILILSGETKYTNKDGVSTLLGLSFLNLLCDPRGMVFSRDHGLFQGVATTVHELGHLIGIPNHDGEKNECFKLFRADSRNSLTKNVKN